MAQDILLTPENLQAEANNLRGNKSTLDGIFQQTVSLITGLLEHWHGEAQQSFTESFNQKKPVFDKFSEDMESFAKFMESYATSMQDAEKGSANRARSLGA